MPTAGCNGGKGHVTGRQCQVGPTTTRIQKNNKLTPRMIEKIWRHTITKDGHGIVTLDRVEACTRVEVEGCTPAEEVEHQPCARVGSPLCAGEDVRFELLQEVAKRLGKTNLGARGNPYWSVGNATAFVYHWCPNCWAGKLILPWNRRGDTVPPEEYRECEHCRFLTKNRNCQ